LVSRPLAWITEAEKDWLDFDYLRGSGKDFETLDNKLALTLTPFSMRHSAVSFSASKRLSWRNTAPQ